MWLDQWGVQWAFLLLALPLQFLLVEYFTSTEDPYTSLGQTASYRRSNRDAIWHGVVDDMANWCSRILYIAVMCQDAVKGIFWGEKDSTFVRQRDEENSFGMFKQENKKLIDWQNMMGGSKTPRLVHPSSVKFFVGQVVEHKHWNYRAVIIGWDKVGNAPEEWFIEMYPKEHRERWRNQPTYRIAIDTRSRPNVQIAYVPQENLRLLHNKDVYSPLLNDVFESFENSRYKLRPGFQRIYPRG